MSERLEVVVYDGKYTFIHDPHDSDIHVHRYKEPWLRIEAGSKAVMQLMHAYNDSFSEVRRILKCMEKSFPPGLAAILPSAELQVERLVTERRATQARNDALEQKVDLLEQRLAAALDCLRMKGKAPLKEVRHENKVLRARIKKLETGMRKLLDG